MFWSLMYPLTFALFFPMNVSTSYFLPLIVCDLTVALLVAAALRKPEGVIQISNCCGHGVFALTTIVWVWAGGSPPPRRCGSAGSGTRSIR